MPQFVSRLAVAVAVIAVTLISTTRGARADGDSSGAIEALFQNPRLPGPENPELEVPQVDVTVIGAPNLPADKFVLVDKSAKPPVEIKASKAIDFTKGKETVAIAIVMNGWELWIGNDKEVPDLPKDDPTIRPGVLIELRSALDRLDFKNAGPPGSLGMVITYADKPVIRVPMGPLSELNGSKLGTQADYFGSKGVQMVSAIRLALAELKKVQAARKVLIVVCDGTDFNMDSAKTALPQLKKEAQKEQIQTFAIVYKAKDSLEGNVIPLMIPQTVQVTTAENIAATIASILARMNDRKYLTFPGYLKDKKVGLKWDNKPHNLLIKVDKEETEETAVVLPSWDDGTGDSGFPWLVLIIILVALILLVIIGAKVFGGAKQPAAPPPMPMMAPAPMPMAPPKPAGPMKTVMIGQGGDEGGFPVVGWLVPLNGAQAYQTLRLRSSVTKIGTAPPADIVINDGFMSSAHCEILCSPQGYVLNDGGSTNGSYVNDKRISGKHDLVDNDLITLGRTNFKFKSIV